MFSQYLYGDFHKRLRQEFFVYGRTDTARGHTSRVCVCDVHTIWYPFRAEVIEHLLWEENAHYTWNKSFILSKNSNNTKISRYMCPYNMLIYFGEYHFVCLCVCSDINSILIQTTKEASDFTFFVSKVK